MDLSGLALGMWEAARLIQRPTTRDEGQRKVARLRAQLENVKNRTLLSDSLRIYFHEQFDPDAYSATLDQLEHGSPAKALPEIKSLVDQTRNYLDESRRAKSDLRRAF
jgi:hypothetical protein